MQYKYSTIAAQIQHTRNSNTARIQLECSSLGTAWQVGGLVMFFICVTLVITFRRLKANQTKIRLVTFAIFVTFVTFRHNVSTPVSRQRLVMFVMFVMFVTFVTLRHNG